MSKTQFFQKRIGNSKLCAVVKNNAYGHGLLRTVGVLADIADCFAVGSVEEALVVKQVAKNVLVLLPQDAENAGKALSTMSLSRWTVSARWTCCKRLFHVGKQRRYTSKYKRECTDWALTCVNLTN